MQEDTKNFFLNKLAKDFEIKEINERLDDDDSMKSIIMKFDPMTTKMLNLFDDDYHRGYQRPLRQKTYELFHTIRLSRKRLSDRFIDKKINDFIQSWEIRLDNFSINDSVNELQYDYLKSLDDLINLLE